MRRSTAWLVGGVLACVAGTAAAQPANLLVNGDPKIAVIDADDNGSITDETDCMFGATVGGSGDVVVTGMQDPGPNLLRACTGSCSGDGLLSSDFIELTIDECEFSHPPFVPLLADFCDTKQSCNEVGMDSASAGSAAGTAPLNLVAGVVARTSTGLERVGFGALCSAGGPAVEVTGDDGVTVLRQLTPFPNPQSPTHMCVANIPVQLDSTGQFVFRTGCFPSGVGGTSFALSSSPESPFARFVYGALPGCGAAHGAPTLSTLGLVALLLAMLISGTWTLRRRGSFASALPLP